MTGKHSENGVLAAQISGEVDRMLAEFLEKAGAKRGMLLVLGGSSSEILGTDIGKGSNAALGQAVIQVMTVRLASEGIALAVQCCEHLNRALVLERELAERRGYTRVNAIPQPHAGGAFAVAAWQYFHNPCIVEWIEADLGIDIGDSFIGMHIRPVLIPIRLSVKQIGAAHLTCCRSRLKLIGGERAVYDEHLR